MTKQDLSEFEFIEAISLYVDKLIAAKPYGKHLFGGFRNLEPDTPEEASIFERLHSFLEENYGRRLDSLFVEDMFDLHKMKKLYPDVLKPQTTTVYRGIELAEFVDLSPKILEALDYTKKLPDGSPFLENYIYTSRSQVESWTTSPEIAVDFASGFLGEYKDGVVLKHKFSQQDLLFNSAFLNKITGFKEDEVIRLGKSPVKCEVYLPFDRIKK